MAEADKGNIDSILTKPISRFSRNAENLLTTERYLRDIEVSVRFERENIDTMSEPAEWGELFADKQTGECILDRLFDHLISVSFSGSSFRGSDRLLLSFKAKSPSVILK